MYVYFWCGLTNTLLLVTCLIRRSSVLSSVSGFCFEMATANHFVSLVLFCDLWHHENDCMFSSNDRSSWILTVGSFDGYSDYDWLHEWICEDLLHGNSLRPKCIHLVLWRWGWFVPFMKEFAAQRYWWMEFLCGILDGWSLESILFLNVNNDVKLPGFVYWIRL